MKAITPTRPRVRASRVISAARGAESAIGFSQKTCLPAARACVATGAWNLFGTMTETASLESNAAAKTSLSEEIENGDATNVPASKAGSVTHFEGEVLADNIVRFLEHRDLHDAYDGHANCFIETGFGKALLIDFNYDTEPLPGEYPVPGVGPFKLLKETRINHLGKLAFKWIYWNMLLPGRKLPVSATMSMAGKHTPKAA